MEEYKFRHSRFKIIGSILFFICSIASVINAILTGDIEVSVSLLAFAVLGGMLIMVGLFNEI